MLSINSSNSTLSVITFLSTGGWKRLDLRMVKQMAMAAIPTSPLTDPLPSNMAIKQAGPGLEEVQPMGVEWGVVWREAGVLFLGVTMLPLRVGLRGMQGMVGVLRDLSLLLKEEEERRGRQCG